ncbi:168_t:CDS:1 [Paraglomus occultum]|uniref:168_t:CDS:1 n=1 Tax=Paraglomus occultum TaxID=144539 RepID=A0A9N9BY40_9GLOM|nr:168_t:CDS:1 [Paraglomus occultum]
MTEHVERGLNQVEFPLRKKGNACGRLKLTAEHIENYPDVPDEARVYLKPGANEEGYWTATHLIEQVGYKAIEALFPNCIAVFAFDNSSNHSAFAADALVAKRMNIGPGGNAPKMRDTFWGPNNERQTMNFPDDRPRGIKQILSERGL